MEVREEELCEFRTERSTLIARLSLQLSSSMMMMIFLKTMFGFFFVLNCSIFLLVNLLCKSYFVEAGEKSSTICFDFFEIIDWWFFDWVANSIWWCAANNIWTYTGVEMERKRRLLTWTIVNLGLIMMSSVLTCDEFTRCPSVNWVAVEVISKLLSESIVLVFIIFNVIT